MRKIMIYIFLVIWGIIIAAVMDFHIVGKIAVIVITDIILLKIYEKVIDKE